MHYFQEIIKLIFENALIIIHIIFVNMQLFSATLSFFLKFTTLDLLLFYILLTVNFKNTIAHKDTIVFTQI